ncbi:helix-turn-helix domain-containing protein [Campylobacter hyointestinalis]|uniref:helix-turn-helix domain-containing protein n=1 Tax=Campylobacter hyointestinalis TaxID=198 RepID=UPI000CE46C8D|nr:helix-turn-helix transcriptional regulator [Campylobacter hyointestinalis]PPB63121.1 transcriptional regulator [Campylobacter hyointestinalis subsp. hyointestinalis]PPB65391.1 transcriptional regulator [Campylobacter hyointestinalis subsp. hyointestinalis]
MTSEELKAFCKERNLTYKELAELIGMTEPSLRGAISTNKISLQTEKAVELLKEIESLKSELADWHAIKNLMQKNFTK